MFLLYTGADLASPQVCGEELLLVPADTPVSEVKAGFSTIATQSIVIKSSATDRRDQLPEQPGDSDDDCCCCCAHVLPGTVFSNATCQELKSPPVTYSYRLATEIKVQRICKLLNVQD